MNRQKRTLIAAVAASTLVVLVGCSSSSSSSTTASSSTGSATSGGSPAASGSPIVIGSIAPVNDTFVSFPEAKAGEEAAVSAINAAGGINGHPLQLNFCDSQFVANLEISCMRSLTGSKVSALVATDILADTAGTSYKIAAQAQTALVGTLGTQPIELNSPTVFPASSGNPGQFYALDAAVLQRGAKKVAIFVVNNAPSEAQAPIIAAGLKLANVTPVGTFIADPTSDPTMSAVAQKVIASGADAVIGGPDPVTWAKFVAALRQAGYKGVLATISGVVPQAELQAMGSAADGMLVSSDTAFVTDTANAGVRQFLADMKKYQPSAQVDGQSMFGWAGVELFAKVAATLKSWDPATVLRAFENISTPVDIGVIALYHTAGVTSPVSAYSRILNPTAQVGVVQNGTIEPNGQGFFNPFSQLAKLGG
jgi:branched-chain amino acid transport system substrate-binding protein